MSRFTEVIRPAITQQAAVLAGTLIDVAATAFGQARLELGRYPHDRFPHLLPLTMRCGVRLGLEDRQLPGGWRVTGNSRLMGQLMLSSDELGVDLRLLKERRRTYPGGTPTAGRSPSRRHAWTAHDEPIDHPFFARGWSAPEPERTTILWLWDFQGNPMHGDCGITQRLVHATGPGVYGHAVPLDLSIDLLSGGGIFDRLTFKGGDEATDLFASELDETVEDDR